MPTFVESAGRAKILSMSKITKQFHTSKCLISYLLSNCCSVFLLISQKARKAKGLEKHGRCSKLVKQIFFFYSTKITNCTIAEKICTRFTHYLLSTLCSCIKHQNTDSQLNIKTKLLNYWFNFVFFFLCVNKILSIQTKNLKCLWNKIAQ